MRLVVAALRKHWGLGLLIFGGLVIDMAFSAAVPMSFKYLLDYAIVPRNGEILVLILAGLAGGVVLAAGAYIGCDYLYAKFTTGVLNDLRWQMFTQLQRLSMSFFTRTQAADILSRFSSDLNSLDRALWAAKDQCALPAMDTALSACLLLMLDWRLGLIAMLAIPAGFVGPRVITPRATRGRTVRKQTESQTASTVQENISGQTIIKAFSLEKSMLARFAERIKSLAVASLRVIFLSSLIEQSAAIGTLVVQVLVLGVGGYMAFHDQLSIGSLVAFQALFVNFKESLAGLTHFYPLARAGRQPACNAFRNCSMNNRASWMRRTPARCRGCRRKSNSAA